jgi:hypothetical protein
MKPYEIVRTKETAKVSDIDGKNGEAQLVALLPIRGEILPTLDGTKYVQVVSGKVVQVFSLDEVTWMEK